MNDEL